MNGTDGIVIGVSGLEQLHQNLDSCVKGPLPERVVTALDDAWFVTSAEAPNYWQLDLEDTSIDTIQRRLCMGDTLSGDFQGSCYMGYFQFPTSTL